MALPLLASPLAAAPAIDARAVQDFTSLDLDQLARVKIMTATLHEADPFSLPFMAVALTRRSYEEQLPRSLPMWLDGVAGVMVQKTANGQGSPFIRGFTGFHTLLLIDGIRLNNSVFRDGPNQYWNTVDPLSVDRLEIVKGPGSVLHGSDAIGGTVNARTLGRSLAGGGAAWAGGASYRLASAEDSHTVRAETGFTVGGQAGLHLGATRREFGDLRGGRAVGVQPRTGYRDQDYDAKFDWRIRPHLRLTLAHQSVRQDDVMRTHSTLHGSTWRGLMRGMDLERSLDQRRQLDYVQFHATELPGFAEEVHVSVSRHIQREDQFRLRSNLLTETSKVDVATFGVTMRAESPLRTGRWTYGGTFYRDRVDSETCRFNSDGTLQFQEIQGPVADNSTYDLLGFFVQNQLPAIGPVEIGVRGRFEHAAADVGRFKDPVTGEPTAFAKSWASFVGSARALVHLDRARHWHVFGGVGQGFRAPNLSDLTRMDIRASGQIEAPATSVEPEHFLTYEAGLKARLGRLEFEASIYHTVIDELIIRTPTGRTISGADEVTKRNSGTGFIQGAELQGSVRLHPRWTALAALTWMDGKVDVYPTANPASKVRERVSRLMPPTSHLTLRWADAQRRLRLEGSCTVAAKQDRLSPNDRVDTERIPPGGTPGHVIWTLRAGWHAMRYFRLSAAVENLTDRDYRIHGSGLNEPGRNLVLAGNVQF